MNTLLIKPSDIIENDDISESSVIIQQIRSISKIRLSKFKGKLSREKLKEVSLSVNELLYKNIPLLEKEKDAQQSQMNAAKNDAPSAH